MLESQLLENKKCIGKSFIKTIMNKLLPNCYRDYLKLLATDTYLFFHSIYSVFSLYLIKNIDACYCHYYNDLQTFV